MIKELTKYLFILLLSAGVSTGCDNFLTPSVDQNKTTDNSINSLGDLQKAVNGALNELTLLGDPNGQFTYYGRDFPVTLEVSSDNAYSLALTGRFVPQDQLIYTSNSGYATGLWQHSYAAISDLNLALQANNLDSTPKKVQNIRGQAYALRAFLHLNLLMSFGQQYVSGAEDLGVPYVTTFNQGNLYPSRNTISEVWNKIGADFSRAVSLMKPNRSPDFDNTHMNYWAARGLQSRYFLYHEQWDSVKVAAEDIINNGPFSITRASDYVSTWLSGSGPQSLFELSFIPSDHHSFANIAYIYRYVNPPGTYGDVVVSKDLYDAYDEGDIRLELYATNPDTTTKDPDDLTYRMNDKYHDINGNDNTRVIRYAEIILNYAEALARTGNQPEALEQLTKITSNRNEEPYLAGTVENVLKERRKELAMEGFRLYDLARTGSGIPLGDSQSLRKEGIPAGSFKFALPIPDGEIRANANIVQNKGYK